MSRSTELFAPGLCEYIEQHSVREIDLLRQLREETASNPRSHMQIPPEQGVLLQLLVKMIGARRALEIGVFTGYSSLAVAVALPADGHLVACDISEEYTAVARRYWAKAGVAEKIHLRVGPAMDTLDDLIAAGASETFDIAFIDADKTAYRGYYERCLKLVRPNGLILLDNMLQHGLVMAESREPNVQAIQELNDFIHRDERVDALLLPFGDGLTIALRR
jgi:predicted O-methyltransferase YrrM